MEQLVERSGLESGAVAFVVEGEFVSVVAGDVYAVVLREVVLLLVVFLSQHY